MPNQKGFGYLPVLLGVVVIALLFGGYVYFFNPNLLQVPSKTPQAAPEEIEEINLDEGKDPKPPCKPKKGENSGSCALGNVEIFASRKLSADKLENILRKYNLKVEYAYNTYDPDIHLVILDQRLSKEEWELKLNVFPAKKALVEEGAYTDGIHIDARVYFDRSISDEQIQQYIQSNKMENYAQQEPLNNQDIYILLVPDGTEYDWDEKLKKESSDIILVRPYYPSYGVPDAL